MAVLFQCMTKFTTNKNKNNNNNKKVMSLDCLLEVENSPKSIHLKPLAKWKEQRTLSQKT